MIRRIDLIGMPTDVHSSFLRGPAKAPPLIRAALFSPHGNAASERGLELGAEINLHDCGDLPLTETSEDDARIRDAVDASLLVGAIPICLGGDHSITYPIIQAVAGHHGPVDILHFDAHPDLYDELDGDRRSHASPFARIMEDGLCSRIVQIGIRTLNKHQREQAERFGVEQLEMRDVGRVSFGFERPLYISIDLDGFDPAFAPGVSHHEPGGLSVRDVMDQLLDLNVPLLGADVVELNPDRDINGVTAVLAAKLVKELAALASA
ncbi:MAG: agmatinase [Proteobacteria bacterium]|nr:agmatinase [Pseudomonadota bacterium]